MERWHLSFLLIFAYSKIIFIAAFEEGSVEYCMYEFPYTYSKCVHLCREDMDPSCFADSMCVCRSVYQYHSKARCYRYERRQSILFSDFLQGNSHFRYGDYFETLHPDTRCWHTDSCEEACREKYYKLRDGSQDHFSSGVLCERDGRTACVCSY